jgi:hypothetical protein
MPIEMEETLLMVASFLTLGVVSWGMGYGATKILRLFEVSSSLADK